MARKTNKTAHVLNLISKAKEEHQTEAYEDNIEINSIENSPTGDLSFMNTEISNDENLAERIKDNLSKITESDETSGAEKSDEKLTTDKSISLDTTIIHDNNESDYPEEETQTDQNLCNNLSVSQNDPGYSYVNVLEEVVKLRADEFIEMFDVCKCPRCRADIVALTLNGLTPKYIVVDSSHVSPLLNFFSNHYKSAVTAQLSRACTIVKDNPHH